VNIMMLRRGRVTRVVGESTGRKCGSRRSALAAACAALWTMGCSVDPPVDDPSAPAEITVTSALSAGTFRGYADPLYGSKDQNRCLMNVTQAFNSLPRSPTRNRYQSRGGKTLPPYNKKLATFEACAVDWHGNITIDRHIQGVARLAGVGDNRWLAVTRAHNLEYAGVHLARMGDLGGADGTRLLVPGTSYADPPPSTRGTEYFYSQFLTTHPGGVQAFGHYLAVAVEATNQQVPRLDVFDFSGGPGAGKQYVYYLGNLGETPGVTKAITGVGVTRLTDGRYLFFVLGKDENKDGWFYVSNGTQLTKDTKLEFVDYVNGTDTTPQGSIRMYQNVNLITECGSRDIYLLATGNEGYAGSVASGTNYADLFRVSMVGASVKLERTASRNFEEGGSDACTFRAGATSFVDRDGRLLLYCHAHHANTDIFCDADSKLKWTEYAYEGCPNSDSGTCCAAGTTSCGDGNCCGGTQSCMASGPQMGICCANAKICGGACCGATDACMGNRCCTASQQCGSVCCADGMACKDRSRSLCCGPFDTACGSVCCGPTQQCVSGRCQTPPPPTPGPNCGAVPSCSTVADCPAAFHYCGSNGCCGQIR
jgi:hypothetical protein